MLELKDNILWFCFPEVHPDAKVGVLFNRTLRIPDDGKTYPLPPGLGRFPIKHVDDHKDKIPEKWIKHGGVMLPMWQSEAMWVQFVANTPFGHGHAWPFAIKVSTGKRSAVTGKPWSKTLREGDYCIVPEQPWLDGYVVEDGVIRQFVAAPLGMGVTAEEQITGKAEFGGLQIEVYPMKAEEFMKRYPKRPSSLHHGIRLCRSKGFSKISESFGGGEEEICEQQLFASEHEPDGFETNSLVGSAAGPASNYSCNSVNIVQPVSATFNASLGSTTVSESVPCGIATRSLSHEVKTSAVIRPDMGLAPGGRMAQQVFADAYGPECWDRERHDRCFVHLSNSLAWQAITGQKVPTMPFTAADYSRKGYPWFDHYREDLPSVKPNQKLASLKSAVQMGEEKGVVVVMENESAQPKKVVHSGHVRNGDWR